MKHKNRRDKNAGQKGSVLVGIMAFGILIAMGSISILNMLSITINQEISSLSDGGAFYAAESGLLMGAKWMEQEENCETAGDLAPGHGIENVIPGFAINGFDVRVDIMRNNSDIFIVSTALSEETLGYDKIISQVSDPKHGAAFDSSAFNYAIYTDQDFDFGGCGNIAKPDGSSAPIHSNGNMVIRGNANGSMHLSSSTLIRIQNPRTVEGTGRAPVFDLHKKAEFTGGTTVESVPEISFPEIDLDPWYQEALANGEVHNGFSTSSSYTPVGGILWVNGDVNLSGGPGTTFTGQIIATGKVKISGQVNVNAPDTGFAIASQAGGIDITTSGTIRGLVYARNGSYKQTANGNLEGQLIIRGDIDKGGNSDVVVFKKTIPIPPGGKKHACPNLVAGSWSEDNE